MPWVRYDDDFPNHWKIEPLSDAAYRLHTTAIFWVAKQLTDGYLPENRLDLIAPRRMKRPQKYVSELVAAGVWEPVDGGWQLHDYLDYQPSKAQVKAEREKSAERQRRWRERRNPGRDNASSDGASNGVTDDVTNDAPTRPDPSRTSYREGHSHDEGDDGALFDAAPAPKKKTSRKKPEVPLPDDFTVTDEMRAWAAAHTPGIDVERATAKFRNHAIANDRRQRDWTAAWRNWMLTERPNNVVAIRGNDPMSEKHAMLARQRAWAEAEDAKELTR
jgi:hypothetical protein